MGELFSWLFVVAILACVIYDSVKRQGAVKVAVKAIAAGAVTLLLVWLMANFL